jgi:hypothetical protein
MAAIERNNNAPLETQTQKNFLNANSMNGANVLVTTSYAMPSRASPVRKKNKQKMKSVTSAM